jgi:DNA-binding transcriptional LysR family regulator
MNDRQLRYAVKVRDELSFSRAAERLLLSQSSISEQVSLLEAELGFALFRRAGRGVEVTQAGRIFLHQAEQILANMAGLHDLGRQLSHGPARRFSVGMSPAIIEVIVPLVADVLRQTLPDIRLSMTTGMAPQVQRLVMQQVLDVGITIQISAPAAHAALIWEPFAALDIALFVPPAHRLAAVRRPIALAEIAHEPLVMSDPTLGYGALVQSMFADQGVQPNIVSIADQTNTLKMMVRAGVGVGILPAITAREEVEAGHLRQLALRPSRTVSLCIVRSAKALDSHVEGCISLIRSALTKEKWTTRSKSRGRH